MLILDDVFAELDTRRRRPAGRAGRAGAEQVLVTAAVPADVPEQLAGAAYDVADGEVTVSDDPAGSTACGQGEAGIELAREAAGVATAKADAKEGPERGAQPGRPEERRQAREPGRLGGETRRRSARAIGELHRRRAAGRSAPR